MGAVLSIMILCGGVWLTGQTGFVQQRLGQGLKAVMDKETGEGISSFGVLCTTLAATLGTGNIVGVSAAIAMGGAGALFWMVAGSVLCMAVKYAECALAVVYRRPTATGYEGGPYYYIEFCMGKGWARIFAFCGAAAGALGMGTLAQGAGVIDLLQESLDAEAKWRLLGVPGVSMVVAVILSLSAATVLWGGRQRISSLCQAVVPIMAVGYVGCCIWILCRHAQGLPEAMWSILQGAFSWRAGTAGMVGAMVAGISRGVFSNEAGLGSAAIAAAAAKGNSPSRQGLIGLAGVFIDTTLMCTLSGLCIVVTGSAQHGGNATDITAGAFATVLGRWSEGVLGMFLCFFAFTSIVGWYFYARGCFVYLTGGKGEKWFCLLYVGVLLVTPLMEMDRIWAVADLWNTGMALPNLLALYKLRGQIRLLILDK